MRLHRSTRHIELTCNFSVIAALQKQFDDLLFARTEPNRLLTHQISPLFKLLRSPRDEDADNRLSICKIHSIHVATLRLFRL